MLVLDTAEAQRLEHPLRQRFICTTLLNIQEKAPFFNDGHLVYLNHFQPALIGIIDVRAVHLCFSHADGIGRVAAKSEALLIQSSTQGSHAAHIEAENVGGLVMGWPLNMDGSEGPRVQATQAFLRNLGNLPDFPALPVLLWDERLSTAAVERTLLEADTSRAKRADVIDKMAAAYILQGAIDAHYGV